MPTQKFSFLKKETTSTQHNESVPDARSEPSVENTQKTKESTSESGEGFRFQLQANETEQPKKKPPTLPELRKKHESLKLAKDRGYKIHPMAIQILENEIRRKEGIVQVWTCEKCKKSVEMFVPARSVECCRFAAKLSWTVEKAIYLPS